MGTRARMVNGDRVRRTDRAQRTAKSSLRRSRRLGPPRARRSATDGLDRSHGAGNSGDRRPKQWGRSLDAGRRSSRSARRREASGRNRRGDARPGRESTKPRGLGRQGSPLRAAAVSYRCRHRCLAGTVRGTRDNGAMKRKATLNESPRVGPPRVGMDRSVQRTAIPEGIVSICSAVGRPNRGYEGLVERCRRRAIRSRPAKTTARVERVPFAAPGLVSARPRPGLGCFKLPAVQRRDRNGRSVPIFGLLTRTA